jgi:hypothetical protein
MIQRNMARFNLQKLTLRVMASGHQCLELSEEIDWDEFPQFAEKLIMIVGVKIIDKAESVEMRIWNLQFPTCRIRLVYDDYPQMISLESDTPQGDDILKNLAEQMKDKRTL